MGFLHQLIRNIGGNTRQLDKEFNIQTKTLRDLADANFCADIGLSRYGDFALAGNEFQRT